MIEIRDISGEVLMTVPVLADALSHEELMSSDYVQLSWSSDRGDILPVGCHIIHGGEKYSLLEDYVPSRANEAEFKYAPQFQSRIMRWQKAILPVYTYKGDGVTVKTRELDWNFTGTPADAMFMVRQALLNETGESWNVELGADLPETISLTSQSSSIWSVLSDIAELCETEWWADKAANYLYLGKCYRGVSASLEAGRNVGVPSVTRSSDGYYTRFYAFGSTRNVTQDNGVVRGSIVNKRLGLDPVKYPMGYKDIKGHFENGVFVSDLHPDEVFPLPLYFEDIYPSSKLTISNVRRRLRYHLDDNDNRIRIGGTDENPEYDQYAIWYFRVEGFEFSEELIIEGQELSAHFKSGQLRGREFALTYHKDAKVVADKADVDKLFAVGAGDYEIKFDEQTEGFIIPSVDYIIPADGDEVVIFNIKMPQEYTDSAMAELEQRLDEEIAERLKDNSSYEFDSNPVAFHEDMTDVVLGQRVSFVNDGRTLETRVTMVEKRLDFPCQQRIRVGNNIVKGSRQQLKDEVREVGREVNRLHEQGGYSAVVQRDHTRELMLSAGRYMAMQDTLEMLKGAVGGYSDAIDPITVQTIALMVGDQSLQFRFTKSRGDLTPVVAPFSYDRNAKQLNAVGCSLIHLTLGIDSITAKNVRKASDYRSWDMGAWHSEIFDNPEKKYYLYAKVEKEGTVGTYVLSETAIGMEQAADYYHLLVGVLNAEYADTRELVTLYGFTEVLPSQITTNIIRSTDGSCYFDLENNEIGGAIKFKAGSSGIENVEGLAEAVQESVGGLEFGKYNLVRNSGFTGDFVTESLDSSTILDESQQLFSHPFRHWNRSNAIVQDSEVSESGKECVITTGGYISQKLQAKMIKGESYVVSFRAKGGSVQIVVAGFSKTLELSEDWQRYVVKFTAVNDISELAIISSNCTICEIQLERGNVVSAWGYSMWDNESSIAKYQSMQYLEAALAKGGTDVVGGLIFSNLLLLGNPSKSDNTAGVSGIYEDDTDVSFWAGGSYAQAIATVAKYVEDPTYQPTDAEVALMAKAVITHGGRAILNDIILRGTIYTKKGMLGNLNITEDGIEVGTNQGGRVTITSAGIMIYNAKGYITGSLGYCGGTAISAVGEGGVGSCPLDRYHTGVYAASDKAAVFCPNGMYYGLRSVTRVVSEPGGTDADNPPNSIDSLDNNILVNMTSGTCYLKLSAVEEDGQEVIVESLGATINVRTGDDNIYSMAAKGYYGANSNPYTKSSGGVVRFKYYKGAGIWTATVIS